MAKKILIDGRFIGVGESISRYVLELVKNILEIDHTNSYTLLIRPVGTRAVEAFFQDTITKKQDTNKSQINSKLQNACYMLRATCYQNLQVQVLDIPHYSIGEQTKLLKYLNDEKFDLVHFTQFNHPVRYHGKYVVTIHDLTMVGHLHRNLPHKRLAFGMVMKSAAKDSARIIAISKTTMNDVIDYYDIPKDKFDIIYHGVDHKNFNMNVKSKINEIEKFKKKYNIAEDYILYTGMWKRHKNLLRLLKAFEIFRIKNKESRIMLVLVGKIDRKEPEVISEINRINKILDSKYMIHNSIMATGFVEEEELPISYAGAFAYCIPSLSEGFGWPPLEAMACGTPVISSKESCMPEILGKAPLYFDTYDTFDIAEKIKIITTDNELRKELIAKGLEQVRKYNWEECAEKTLEVYKKLLGEN